MSRSAIWALAVLVLGGLTTADASERRPQVTAAATLAGQPGETVGIDIAVGPSDVIPQHSFIRLRGLPLGTRLSAGNAVSPTVWAVPLAALAGLKLTLPTELPPRTEVSIALMTIDGEVLAERPFQLAPGASAAPADPRAIVAIPPAAAAPVPPPAAVPAPAPAPRAPAPKLAQPSQEDRARAESFMARAAQALERGDIATARAFLERAVDLGDANAALRLGATFDPAELGRMGAVGIKADPALARQWYEKARDLGATAVADERLKRLAGR
jgi:TPR repeat protein